MAKQQASISGVAHVALANKLRQWSGWHDASLVFGVPTASPWAQCIIGKHQFTVNADELVLNPNRVINSVTPFRLRQEAVLTGVMLHEAAHARYSQWCPTNKEELAALKHSPALGGKHPTPQVLAMAKLVEEARIEGKMACGAVNNGAEGLVWTMQAAAAKLLPMTSISADNADKALMDLITSWVLRAGRAMAIGKSGQIIPPWAREFNALLKDQILSAMLSDMDLDPDVHTQEAMGLLYNMVCDEVDAGSGHIDDAKRFLDLVFPETGGRVNQPTAGPGCTSSAGDGEDPEPTDELGEKSDEKGSAVQETLTKIEQESNDDAKDGASHEQDKTKFEKRRSEMIAGNRQPTKDERNIAHTAEKFLRTLIEPTESSKVLISDQPSSMVDGAALSQWRASGGQRDPRFFKRTKRSIEPTPPVKVAILVDRSASMEALQRPSAVLAWALASAATDLSNFAGRGQQIEVCMVLWGTGATVIQAVGAKPEGISERKCNGGTYAQAEALALVEEQLPGFFDAKEQPEHRLLIEFTDWELNGSASGFDRTRNIIHRGLCSGMDMLTVAPRGYNGRKSVLPHIMFGIKGQTGRSLITKYNTSNPGDVWEKASEVLL